MDYKNINVLNPKIRILKKALKTHSSDSFRENFYINNQSITRLLISFGIDYKCVECDVIDKYNNEPIVLHIDHINGNKYDNRLENLRFLCPNCHSQTQTFGRKNKFDYSILDKDSFKKQRNIRIPKPILNCITCSKIITKGKNNIKYCSYKCSNVASQKIELTTVKIFSIFRENNNNFTKTAKQIGISDNAIRKRLKNAGFI